jgi:uncharacterized delta-60 repeat protein
MRTLGRMAVASIIAGTALLAASSSAMAAPGDLDLSFDRDGRKTIDPGVANDVLVQPDGRIVVAGYSRTGAQDFLVARLNADGSLDESFGAGGLVRVDFGDGDYGFAAALQRDGRIVVAGSSARRDGREDVAVARLNANGFLDRSFDHDGIKTIAFSRLRYARDVLVQPDGRILVAGTGVRSIVITRLNADGSPDPSFDADGESSIDFGSETSGFAVALQPDGKIVAGGGTNGGRQAAVVRLNANGSLDTGFDFGGKQAIDRGGFQEARDVLVQPDGRIVLTGWGQGDIVVTRLNPDGSPDTRFAGDGAAAIGFGAESVDAGFSAALQSDGTLVVAGVRNNDDFALLRLRPDGALDTSFSFDGRQVVDFGGSDNATAVSVQPDGRIVVAGNSGRAIALTRVHGDPLVQEAESAATPTPGPSPASPPADPPVTPPVVVTTEAPPAFGASTLVALELGQTRIATRPAKVRVANRNRFAIDVTLSGRTAKAVGSGRRKRRIAIRTATVRVPAGATSTIGLKLPKALRRLAQRRGGLKLRLTSIVRDPAGNTRAVTKTVTVR